MEWGFETLKCWVNIIHSMILFYIFFFVYLVEKKIKEMSELDGNILAAQFRELQQGIVKLRFFKKFNISHKAFLWYR